MFRETRSLNEPCEKRLIQVLDIQSISWYEQTNKFILLEIASEYIGEKEIDIKQFEIWAAWAFESATFGYKSLCLIW